LRGRDVLSGVREGSEDQRPPASNPHQLHVANARALAGGTFPNKWRVDGVSRRSQSL
jgi:hypothetical protein